MTEHNKGLGRAKKDMKLNLPSFETRDHSGAGNSYWPLRIRFFIPGEIAIPWLL